MSQARAGSMMNFHRAIRQHGKDAFDFEVLEFCPVEQFPDRETFWIKFYQSAGLKGFNTLDNGYSMRPTYTASEATRARLREAAKNKPPITEATRELLREAGRNMSQETKKKIGRAVAARIVSEETRAKIKASIKNRPPVSDETRSKLAEANRNRSAEVRARMSEAQRRKPAMPKECRDRIAETLKRRGARPPEVVAKMRASAMGHEVSEETRAKLRAASLGQVHSPETRAKISAANLGRKFSGEALENIRKAKTPEWRRKVSETMKKVCAERKSIKEKSQ